jgi:hypothetical protein
MVTVEVRFRRQHGILLLIRRSREMVPPEGRRRRHRLQHVRRLQAGAVRWKGEGRLDHDQSGRATRGRHCVRVCGRGIVMWRRHRRTPPHYLLAALAVPMVHVILVSHCYFLTLVTSQFYATAHFVRYHRFVTALSEERVYGLQLIPTLQLHEVAKILHRNW